MEQTGSNLVWILLAFNILLGIAAFFGSRWLLRVEDDVKELRTAHTDAADKAAKKDRDVLDRLNGYVDKEYFKEFRTELREDLNRNFAEVFRKFDQLSRGDRRPSSDTAANGSRT